MHEAIQEIEDTKSDLTNTIKSFTKRGKTQRRAQTAHGLKKSSAVYIRSKNAHRNSSFESDCDEPSAQDVFYDAKEVETPRTHVRLS